MIVTVSAAVWAGWPLAVRRVSRGLAVAFSDGIWLASWPWVGLLAPLFGLAGGVFVGAMHPGFEVLFIEALWLVIAVAVVGALSGAVGLYLTIGFVIGDLAFAERPLWTTPLQYLPLLLLAVCVPLAAKSLAAELRLPQSVPAVVRAVFGLGAFVLVTGVLVYAWVKATPLILRPVYDWVGELPPRPVILGGRWAVIAAVVAATGRAVAQALLKGMDFPRARPVVPLWDRLPVIFKLVFRAAMVTLLLAGLFANVVQAVLAFVVVLAAQFVATMLRARGQRGYGIPRLVRVLIAVVPVYLAGMWLLPFFIERRATSFVPMLLLALIAGVLLSVVSPVRERPDPAAVAQARQEQPVAAGVPETVPAWDSADAPAWDAEFEAPSWRPSWEREQEERPSWEREKEERPSWEREKDELSSWEREKEESAVPYTAPKPWFDNEPVDSVDSVHEPAPEPPRVVSAPPAPPMAPPAPVTPPPPAPETRPAPAPPEPEGRKKSKREKEPKPKRESKKHKRDTDEDLAWWREDVPEGEHRDVV